MTPYRAILIVLMLVVAIAAIWVVDRRVMQRVADASGPAAQATPDQVAAPNASR